MSNSFETSWTVAHQAPLPMGFPRQESWSEWPFPFPGDLSDPGIEPTSSCIGTTGNSWRMGSPISKDNTPLYEVNLDLVEWKWYIYIYQDQEVKTED